MERKTQMIFDYASQLRLSSFKDQLDEAIKQADQKKSSYTDFALSLLKLEVDHRNRRDLEKRIKTAWLPMKHDLDGYDHSASNGISKPQLNQLRECHWLEQNFNLIIMGPSGIGKTLLASGLCYDALKQGYKAYFRTMEQIVEMIKLKDITRSAASEYKRLLKANLVVIDDIMMFALDKTEAVGLFNFINHLHEKASFIITTNKSPEEWVKLLDDEVIATALLDRLLFHGEVLRLSGKSYRMENRKTIFADQN
jgi:DNA replication protein DnaC